MARQKFAHQQMTAEQEKKKREQAMQWMAANNPNLVGAPQFVQEAAIKAQFPGAQTFGTSQNLVVYDSVLRKEVPLQYSTSGGAFTIDGQGNMVPFNPQRHTLQGRYTPRTVGGAEVPFQPVSGGWGTQGGSAPRPSPGPSGGPVTRPNELAVPPVMGQGEQMAPGSPFQPGDLAGMNLVPQMPPQMPPQNLPPQTPAAPYATPPGMPPGSIAHIPKLTDTPAYKASVTAAQEGAKADVKMQANRPKAERALRSFVRNNNIVVDNINEIRKAYSPLIAGQNAMGMGNLPYTDSRAINNRIETIKSQLGFGALQEMRDNSPTGGAVGSLSEKELELLTAKIAKLDPQSNDFLDQLSTIEQEVQEMTRQAQGAFSTDFGGNQSAPSGMSNDDWQELQRLRSTQGG